VGCIGSSTCQHLGGSAGLASIPIRSITKSSREPIRGSFRNSRWSLRKRVDSCRWFVEGYVSVDTIDNHRHAYVTQSSTSVDNHRQPATTVDITYASPSSTIDKCRHLSTSLRNNRRHSQKLAIALEFLIRSRALLGLFLFFSSSINLTTFLVDLVRDLRHRDPRSRHRQTGSLAVRSLSPSS
jgi:hypothetical protein